MIELVDADKALDLADNHLLLIAFAKEPDAEKVSKSLSRYVNLRYVRVEPTVDAAVVLQLPKHPTFILYDKGREVANIVGVEAIIQTLIATFK